MATSHETLIDFNMQIVGMTHAYVYVKYDVSAAFDICLEKNLLFTPIFNVFGLKIPENLYPELTSVVMATTHRYFSTTGQDMTADPSALF